MKKIRRFVCILLSLMLIVTCTSSVFASGYIVLNPDDFKNELDYSESYSPQNLIGPDDSVKITDEYTVSLYPYNAIGKLQVYHDGCQCITGGTGFLLSSKCIATAAHVFKPCKDHSNPAKLVAMYLQCYKDGTANYAKALVTSTVWGYNNNYSNTNYQMQYDYGYVLLDSTCQQIVSSYVSNYFELYNCPNDNLVNLPITICGFRGTEILLTEASGVVTSLSGKRLFHDVDTLKGQSGSPIYFMSEGKAKVIGIHLLGTDENNYPNSGRKIDSDLITYYNNLK